MLVVIRRHRRQLGRRVAALFLAAFVSGAIAPCVMAASGCPEMKSETCEKSYVIAQLSCEPASLLDCKLPDTNYAGVSGVVAGAPPQTVMALAPIPASVPDAAQPHMGSRHAAGLPVPPPNLKNATLLI
jgi:hypothetical protein